MQGLALAHEGTVVRRGEEVEAERAARSRANVAERAPDHHPRCQPSGRCYPMAEAAKLAQARVHPGSRRTGAPSVESWCRARSTPGYGGQESGRTASSNLAAALRRRMASALT